MTVQPYKREAVAERLLRSSLDHSYEPSIDVDWTAALVEGRYGISPERCSLYGTELWDGLTEEQRVTLSNHEICSIAQVGLWFEVILMQMLVRYTYDRDPRTGHVRYALTEIADECRHSIMFAKLADRFDVPDYRPGRLVHNLGRLFAATAYGPTMFAGVLVAEETLDQLQRESMRDERVQPLCRMVNRIHVTEEARHVRYAREELAALMPRLTSFQRRLAQALTPIVAYVVIRSYINPDVYASVGLDPQVARRAALSNPYHRDTIAWSARKVMPFLREVGIVGGPFARLWRRAGLT